jgi:hypothetical protein
VTAEERLHRDRLLEEGCALAGADDLGEGSWSEGLDRVLDGFLTESRLSEIGVEVAAADVLTYVSNRAAITAWRAAHPEVAAGSVTAPIVIVGQPRTGTTILYDLLAQDPALRSPMSWEVDKPVPPPQPATYDTDPRIDEVQAQIDMADVLIPGFTAFHPIGARLAQECVRITAGDFRSMIFQTQYRLPTYNRWLLDDADLAPAYRWHRQYLQHLQSGVPADTWLLKSPAHLWHLPALLAEYPDAVIVQTHRDPLKVIASMSALAVHLRQMASDETSVSEAAAEYAHDIVLGLERGMAARDDGTLSPGQVHDVHFTDFLGDPIGAIRRLYVALGRELTPDAEQRMTDFLAANPGDGGGAGHRYSWADTGLDAGEVRERCAPYQERFGVRSEPVA